MTSDKWALKAKRQQQQKFGQKKSSWALKTLRENELYRNQLACNRKLNWFAIIVQQTFRSLQFRAFKIFMRCHLMYKNMFFHSIFVHIRIYMYSHGQKWPNFNVVSVKLLLLPSVLCQKRIPPFPCKCTCSRKCHEFLFVNLNCFLLAQTARCVFRIVCDAIGHVMQFFCVFFFLSYSWLQSAVVLCTNTNLPCLNKCVMWMNLIYDYIATKRQLTSQSMRTKMLFAFRGVWQ